MLLTWIYSCQHWILYLAYLIRARIQFLRCLTTVGETVRGEKISPRVLYKFLHELQISLRVTNFSASIEQKCFLKPISWHLEILETIWRRLSKYYNCRHCVKNNICPTVTTITVLSKFHIFIVKTVTKVHNDIIEQFYFCHTLVWV